jgi:hypothetical protein
MTWQTSISEKWNYGREMTDQFSLTMRLPRHCRVLLHAAKLRYGTDGFTSPPKEGMLRIFSPEKSDGFGRVWTLELGYRRPACQPLDHRSRFASVLGEEYVLMRLVIDLSLLCIILPQIFFYAVLLCAVFNLCSSVFDGPSSTPIQNKFISIVIIMASLLIFVGNSWLVSAINEH